MLRLLKVSIFAFLIGAVCSCNESNEVPDTLAPVISVEGLKENQRVHGTLLVNTTAEDQSTELTITIFVDGKVLKELSGVTASIGIDTKTLTEGSHLVKVRVTDKSGNVSEKTFTVEVRNILFRLQVSSNYIYERAEIYFALTRNDGSLIAVEQAKNGSVISVPTPEDFNLDSTFVVGEYDYFQYQDPNFRVRLRTFSSGFRAGEFELAEYENPKPIVGFHRIKITDIPIGKWTAMITATNGGGTQLEDDGSMNNIVYDIPMTGAKSDVYLTVTSETNTPRYAYVSDVDLGNTTEVAYSELTELQRAEVIANGAANYNCDVYRSDDLDIYRNTGHFDDGKLPVYYVPEFLPGSGFIFSCFDGGHYDYNRTKASTVPASFQYMDAIASNVNYADRKLSIKTTGKFDCVKIYGYTTVHSGELTVIDDYLVVFPFGAKMQITIPDTPSELASTEFLSPDAFEFSQAAFMDYKHLSGESDYQKSMVFNANNIFPVSRERIEKGDGITPTNSTGGRISTMKVGIPEELKKYLRGRLPSERIVP